MWPEEGSWVRVELRQSVSPAALATGELPSTQHLEGCLFAVDTEQGLAIIMNPLLPPDYYSLPVPLRPAIQHTVHTIPLASAKSVSTIDAPTGVRPADALPPMRPVKVERLLRREQRALQKRQNHFGSRAPPGTGEAAMTIFAALAKT